MLTIAGLGAGLSLAPAMDAVLAVVPPQRSGSGTAITVALRQVAGAFGVTLLGSLLAAGYRPRIGTTACPSPPPTPHMPRSPPRSASPTTPPIPRSQPPPRPRRTIAAQLAAGDKSNTVDFHYGDPNRFSDADREQLFWDNVDSILTNGGAGMPIEQGFMASYDLEWTLVGEENGNKVIEFHLTNASTWSSAKPNPSKVKGSVYGHRPAGTGELWTKQSVRWRETFPGGAAPQREEAWFPTVWRKPSLVLRPLWNLKPW